MFARGTKITTRRRSTIARTTISAVEVSDRVRFSPSRRDASEDGTRRLSLPHLGTAGRSRPAKEGTSPGRTVYDPWREGNQSALRGGQLPQTRRRCLGSPWDSQLPQSVAPFRRQRGALLVAPVPVDDLVDSDPAPGDRDHERIPHTRRRFRRLLVVEEGAVGSLAHPPDDEVAGLHTAPTFSPLGLARRHSQYRPRTRCSWRSQTSSWSGESMSHARVRWLSSVCTWATTLIRPWSAALRTAWYVSVRESCRLPERSFAVAGPRWSKQSQRASITLPPTRAMSSPFSKMSMDFEAIERVRGRPNTPGVGGIIRSQSAAFSSP